MYNKKALFKFVPKEFPSKQFHQKKQVTDVFTIDENRFVVSNKVSCNNRNGWRYVLCFHEDGGNDHTTAYQETKNIFNYGASQCDNNLAYTVLFNVSKVKKWALNYRNVWKEVESQLGENLKTKPLNGEARYMHGNLKERIKTNVNGQDVLYDMYCSIKEILNVTSVCKQGKNYHLQVYVEECKYINA